MLNSITLTPYDDQVPHKRSSIVDISPQLLHLEPFPNILLIAYHGSRRQKRNKIL